MWESGQEQRNGPKRPKQLFLKQKEFPKGPLQARALILIRDAVQIVRKQPLHYEFEVRVGERVVERRGERTEWVTNPSTSSPVRARRLISRPGPVRVPQRPGH